VLNLLKHRHLVFSERFGRVVLCIPDEDRTEHSTKYVDSLKEQFEELEVVHGMPDLGMCRSGDHCLLILDDLAREVMSSKDMLALFTRDSHHGKISVIFTAQTYFSKNSFGRNIIAQMTYHCIFK
jgi:hypothetical protein